MLHENLKRLLGELAAWLEYQASEPVEWLVCGGLALGLQGLSRRVTRDVDVLGLWRADQLEVICLDEFPEKVKTAIRRVADDHPEIEGLRENWVNLGPSQIAKWGLPSGYENRLVKIEIAPHLILHLLGRVDLIALKLYAASDALGPRQPIHFSDLEALDPSFGELDKAVAWMRSLPDFVEKQAELKETIRRLGHDDLAYYT